MVLPAPVYRQAGHVLHCSQKLLEGRLKKKGRKLPMRKLKEVARLLLECNLGVRPIARACDISTSTASIYVEKFKELGATYKEICEMDEDALSFLLFPGGEKDSIKTIARFYLPDGGDEKKGGYPPASL